MANDVEVKLASSYADYRVVAQRGSLVFFLISTLRGISHMYHTGLSHLQRVLKQSIEASPFEAVGSSPTRFFSHMIPSVTLPLLSRMIQFYSPT